MALLPGFSGTACRPGPGGPKWSQSNGCPVTLRLQQRLQSVSVPADPICRCQNLAQSSGALVSQGEATAQVKITFQFQPPYDLNVLVARQDNTWLVDDITCGSAPSSIYQDPLGPCR